ncbi:MBL fold metallo-hydrolase [Sulfuriferula sp. AH1]|uniref:MBL fold metallo-hydrolase RNA specificity domain-containing protein n=1 Tax=Sulfuriferula sp. AH1 TaxID=1985873 RepID=UPI000B3BA0D1|nr:MBL fold metallo-hydrolase [Sulfuriferula sp. AH1]ARU30982.1 MBL fold metallo-hydrolase [Sulfuriferula sp. AH1]
MNISFHGADRGVTGSCHMISCAGKNILIDCGMYQGGHELDEENSEPFGFDPAAMDYVLLTHAHLDHCGRLPLLVKRGFRGEIITTAASRALSRIVMMDAAGLQEDEARYHARKNKRHGEQNDVEPLYTTLDALNTLEYFGRSAKYGTPLAIAPGISATFLDAGHILGSASILLELTEGKKHRTVAFSGDLGNAGRKLLHDPVPPLHADVVVMETTYGDRLHRSLPESITELYQAINDALQRGGNVIIPTFALERTQELLFYMREGIEQGELPRSMQVFLDSPMAISATEIFKHYPDCYKKTTAALFHAGDDPFNLPGLHFTRETAQSMAINNVNGGAVIMAGSGMCTGGRVRHHLKHNLWRKDSSVIFVGFAAEGTLARLIIDGVPKVRIFGEEIAVKAKIYTINGFSAHADRDELLAWHRHIKPERTFLVHGEEAVMQSFASHLKNTEVYMPIRNQVFAL